MNDRPTTNAAVRTQIYNERVAHPGVWNKAVVVALEDTAAMLNHALIQSRRRYRT